MLRQEPSASEYPVEGGIPRQAQAHLAGCYTAVPRRRGQQTGHWMVTVPPVLPQWPVPSDFCSALVFTAIKICYAANKKADIAFSRIRTFFTWALVS